MNIVVLMSTYNGEKYVEEQIKSILNQTSVNVTLLIRDDGSKDRTRTLLQKYAENNSNIDLRLDQNIGCCASFYKLAQIARDEYPDSNYFAFADQDDVWDSDKLEAAVSMTSHLDKDKPFLYGSNYRLVDQDLNFIKVPQKTPMTLGESLFSNSVIGCTMVFNRKMLDFFLMAKPEQMFLHDCWMIRTCFAIGGNFIYNPNPTMNYRQHGNNVVGGNRSWLKRFKSLFCGYDYDIIEANANIRIIYSNYLTKEAEDLLDLICSYKKCLANKNRIVFHSAIKSDSFLSNLKLYIYIYINSLVGLSFRDVIKNNSLIYWLYSKRRDYLIDKQLAPLTEELKTYIGKDTSVITTNCFAGKITQSMHMQYNTPTAGLYFMYPDYIDFLKNLKHYLLDAEITFVNHSKYELGNKRLREQTLKGLWYPIGLLDGKVEIHFLHYHTKEEAAEKWHRRAKRVNFDSLLVLGFEQNLCSEKDILDFESLPYKHKYMFSSKKLKTRSNIFIKEFEECGEVGNPYLDAPIYFRYLICKIKEDYKYESFNSNKPGC